MAPIKNDRSLTLGRLKELLHYDPDTGLFTRRTQYRGRPIGSIAGTVRKDGYRMISVDDVLYKAARLAWLYVHGCWPAKYIDHINRIKGDDRLCNLREATVRENAANQVAISNTGIRGVHKIRSGYQSVIWRNGRQNYLGIFKNLEEAAVARKIAELHTVEV